MHANARVLPLRAENVPEEIKIRNQWVGFKILGERPNKVPYSPKTGHKASSTDLMTWGTFEEAVEAYESGRHDGVGFVFSSGDPYTGIDLDDCVGEGDKIADWALEIAGDLDSYTELSPTGTGLHIIVRGKVPNRHRGGIEVYSTERFFTVTGHVVGA